MNNFYSLLEQEHATCVIVHESSIIYTSTKRGVAPMLEFYNRHQNRYHNLIIVDKIMGRGAVLLAKLIGGTTLYTPIISASAVDLATEYGMDIHYQTRVPYVLNRTNDGPCPIEQSVLHISDTKKGFTTITETLNSLSQKKNF